MENLLSPREEFDAALKGPFRTSGLDVQWRWNPETKTLGFQCTKSRSDWFFNFFATTVNLDGELVHAGYAALWESVRDEVASEVGNTQGFRIEGYSQGGGLTNMAHWYFQEHDKAPVSVAFAAPKVFASNVHLVGLDNIQVRGDIVCRVASSSAFRHEGNVELIGPNHFPNPWDHAPKAYRKYLA